MLSCAGFTGGFYLLFDPTSTLFKPLAYRAILESRVLPADAEHCHVRFSYYMAGTRVGHLRLRMRLEADLSTTSWKTLWRQTGRGRHDWSKAEVTINAAEPFMLRFLALPVSYLPDNDEIALDDVSFMPCSNETSEIVRKIRWFVAARRPGTILSRT